MGTYFLWGSIGLVILFLGLGALFGMIRGWKRSTLHIGFTAVSVLVAFFIARPISNVLLGLSFPFTDNISLGAYIVKMVNNAFDLSQYPSANQFVEVLPSAIVSPILFILLTIVLYYVIDIIYAITARIAFGKKKADFKKHKPLRSVGSAIGLVEAFMFMVVLFAPITSLTITAQQLLVAPQAQEQVLAASEEKQLETIPEIAGSKIPPTVKDILIAYNNSAIGKIVGAAGFDDAMFDGLSNVKVNGENIKIRPEILTLADTYNNFADLYNKIYAKYWDKIDFSKLKASLQNFIDGGLFKGVVANLAQEYVKNYAPKTEEADSFLNKIIVQLKSSFANKDAYEYLRHDLLLLMDVADDVFDKGVAKEFVEAEDQSVVGLLTVIDTKSDEVLDISQKALDLYVMEDAFSSIIDFASDKLADSIKPKTEGQIIALNSDVDVKTTISSLLDAIEKILDLNESLPIVDLMSSDNILNSLSQIKPEDVDTILQTAGETFNIVRDLDILNVNGQPVFDNILEASNMKIIGETVTTDEGEVTFQTYAQFFDHLKTPIKNALSMNLLQIVQGGDFDEILDNILEVNKDDPEILSKTLMPFYDLSVLDLKDRVFEKIKTELSGKMTDMLDLSKVDGYDDWKTEFNNIGNMLNALNRGDVEGMTYLKYVTTANADMMKLLDAIMDAPEPEDPQVEDDLHAILRPILKSEIFKPLLLKIFGNIDDEIEKFTNTQGKLQTKFEIVYTDEAIREQTLNTIQDLMNIVLKEDMTQVKLATVGRILNILAADAYNNGQAQKGVFNEIFENLIWYITGKDMTEDQIYSTLQPHPDVAKINDILKVAGLLDDTNIYTFDFESAMQTADDVVKLAQQFSDQIKDVEFKADNIGEVVDKLQESLDALGKESEEEIVEVLDKTKDLMDEVGDQFIDDEMKQLIDDNQQTVSDKIDELFGDKPDVQDALRRLLGLDNP